MDRFTFVSDSNEAELRFHSDYSISRSGFSLKWTAVDVSSCPIQTLTAKEGTITSPNYPEFLLANLDCTVVILAPLGKRVWLEFHDFEALAFNKTSETSIELHLGKSKTSIRPFEVDSLLTEGSFISSEEALKIRLKTGSKPIGIGFRATYKIVNSHLKQEKIIELKRNSSGILLHLNYPDRPAVNVNFLVRFIAPIGCVISLEMFHLKPVVDEGCLNGIIEVHDHYYDSNGTVWRLCYDPVATEDSIVPLTPISITSFLNTLHLRQMSGDAGIYLNGTLRVQEDGEFKGKLLKHREEMVENCHPNPCQNGGKCLSKGAQRFCKCVGHFTGKLLR